MQFNDSGFGSSSLYENILFEFFDFEALATLPERFILEKLLPLLDFMEFIPFFYEIFLIFEDCKDDFIDLEVCDFLPLVLLLKTVPLSYSPSSSSSSYPY